MGLGNVLNGIRAAGSLGDLAGIVVDGIDKAKEDDGKVSLPEGILIASQTMPDIAQVVGLFVRDVPADVVGPLAQAGLVAVAEIVEKIQESGADGKITDEEMLEIGQTMVAKILGILPNVPD